jgi:kynurenine 3-monooxygenase
MQGAPDKSSDLSGTHSAWSVGVVGAGPVGSLMAGALARRGHQVTLYERLTDPADDRGGCRTINLSLSPRGLAALDRAGLGDPVRARSIPMVARVFHPLGRDPVVQPYGSPCWRTYSIARAELTRILLKFAVEQEKVAVCPGHECLHADLGAGELVLRDAGGVLRRERHDLVIGADGAGSAVRAALVRTPRVSFAKHVFGGGYRELALTSGAPREAIHIWPRGSFFMVGLPKADGGLRCTLVLGDEELARLTSARALEELLASQFPDAFDRLDASPEELVARPVGAITSVRLGVFHYRDRALVAGDAAHAVVPFMGQGVNLGLEDCDTFLRLLDEGPVDLGTCLEEYTRLRLPESLACADLSARNYVELVSGATSVARSVVAEVNFSGRSYRAIAEEALPGWRPEVVAMAQEVTA